MAHDFERDACRIVDVKNVNDDDCSDAKACKYEAPDDVEKFEKEYEKIS